MKLAAAVFGACTGIALIAGLASCVPARHIACASAVPIQEMVLVYPVDGATGVPDSPGTLVFSFPNGPVLSGAKAALTPSGGQPIVSGPQGPVPSPLPAPNTSPSPGTRLVAFPISPLTTATTYQLSFQGSYTTTGICGGTFPLAGTGDFTTR